MFNPAFTVASVRGRTGLASTGGIASSVSWLNPVTTHQFAQRMLGYFGSRALCPLPPGQRVGPESPESGGWPTRTRIQGRARSAQSREHS